MTLELYIRLGDKADTLIKKYGRKVQMIRRSYGEIDPRDCWVVRTQFDPRLVDGELIMWTDHRYLMSPDVDPAPKEDVDRLIVDGQELRVVKAVPLKPADLTLLYDVQARSS